MPAFRNKETGQVVNFEGQAALNAAQSGLYEPLENGGAIPVVTPSGRETYLNPADAQDYSTYLPVGAEDPGQLEYNRRGEERQRRLQEEYGGLGGELRAGVEGGLSAVTLGGYDVLNKALGGEAEKYAKANPGFHAGGEVLGLLGASLIPGVGEEALGEAGGRLLSGNIAGAVSKGSGALAESLGGLKGAAAAGALEGLVYGTGQTVSHALVTDEPLTASALYGEMIQNGLWGLGIGGATGALAKTLAKAGSKLKTVGEGAGTPEPILDLNSDAGRAVTKRISDELGKLDNATEAAAARLDGKPAPTPSVPDAEVAGVPRGPLSADDLPTQAELDQVPAGEQPEPPEQADAIFEPAKPDMARHKILKAAGSRVLDAGIPSGALEPADVRSLRRAYSRMDEAFTFAREDGTKAAVAGANRAANEYATIVAQLGKKAGVDVSADLQAQVRKFTPVEERLVAAAPREPAVETPSPTTEPTPAPSTTEVTSRAAARENLLSSRRIAKSSLGLDEGQLVQRHHIVKMLQGGEPADILNNLRGLDGWATALRNTATLYGDARFLRTIDKALANITDAVEQATGGVRLSDIDRDVIADMLQSSSMSTAEFDNDAVARLHEAAALSKVTRGFKLPKGVTRKSSINSLFVSASARAAGRAASQVASGGGFSAGQAARAGLTGAAAATGYHAVHTLAAIASGGVGRIVGAAARAAGHVLSGASKVAGRGQLTAAYLIRESRWDHNQAKPAKPSHSDLQRAFQDRADELTHIAANPMAAQMAIHSDLAPLRQVHPRVADEFEMLAIKAPQYLYDKMPKDPGVIKRFGRSAWKPSGYEILQWGEHMRGVADPIGVYEEALQSGYITPQAADALRTIHPDLYQRMQIEVFQRADELRYKLDYQAQIRLSILFNVPVNSSMSPDFRAFMKQRYIARAQQSKPAGGQMGASSGSTSAAEPLTGAQQLLKQVG